MHRRQRTRISIQAPEQARDLFNEMIPKKDPITKKKEILSNFKATFSKKLANDIEDEIEEDNKRGST